MAKRGRVGHRRQAAGGGRRRGSRRRDSASGDDDDEYVVVDDESESTDESLVASSDDENFEINASDDDFDDDEDEDDDFVPRRSKNCNGSLRKNRKSASDDDYEEEEEELMPSPIPKRKSTVSSRRRKSSASEADEDFNPDEDEFDEEVVMSVKKSLKKKSKSNSRRQPPKKRRRKAPKQKKKVMKRRALPASRSDDDDFVSKVIISDSVSRIRKNRGTKLKKKRNVRKKRSADYSDKEDFDFVVDSEDEYEEEKNNTWTRNSNTNGKRLKVEDSEPEFEDSESEFDSFVSDEDVRELDVRSKKAQQRAMTSRRSRGLVADSDSSDFDYEISDEELRDLRIPMPKLSKPLQLPKRSDIKGKEKEEEDIGKRVCGICLSEEQKTTVQGMLDCCSHYYCFQCIIEWSKVESRCPVCKRRFSTISKSGRADPDFVLRKQIINIPKRDQVYQPSEEEMRGYIDPYENVVCIVCQEGGDDSLMLLCDICDSSAHTYCVGIGREVPEGNWYCEACRSADDGLSHTQVHDSEREQVSNTNDSLCAGFDIEDLSLRSAGALGFHFPHGLDLNAPPRDCLEEDLITAPLQQPSGAGASTLSGRRAIHQRIRFILSSQVDRSREVVSTSNENGRHNNLVAEPGVEPSYPAARNVTHVMNSLPNGHSRFRLSPCIYREDNVNFRHVDGAKELVQSKVRNYLRKWSKDIQIDNQAVKNIARCSTHTILAACGIDHRKEKVVGPVQALDACYHSHKDGPVFLPVGCCSSCFDSFIEGVVSRIINT